MKRWIIATLGLKGSWRWAKKQMMKGRIVRCEHWVGELKLRIDNKTNTLLQSNFTTTPEPVHEHQKLWETSNHFLSYENYDDYVVFEW